MTERSEADGGLWTRFVRLLSKPVDSAWLGAFRFFYGSIMSISMLRFLAYGWIDELFVQPSFHFKYWLFDWVDPLPRLGLYGVFAALLVCALCVALGLFFRLAISLFLLGFAYVSLLDVTIYLNHYYLAFLLGLLLALSPAGKVYSLDALARRQSLAQIPRFWLILVRFQVGTVYTFAGVAKATGDWLLHAQPLQIWLSARTDLPLLGPVFQQPWAAPLMSWAGFLFDTTIVWWLLWSRTRPFAYAVVIFFHLITGSLFPIGMFPFIMVLSALVFFPPDWPRRLLARWRKPTEGAPVLATVGAPPVSTAAALALVIYCAFQLLFPLRFLAYGGDVLWHEQGMRFSWRVMVREKNGSITFHVRQKQTGRTFQVNPRRWLNAQQAREMSSQPDLILQFAHFLRDEFQARGFGPVEVRAEAHVSLNGRPGMVLIDPSVDLSQVSDGMAKARWILSGPSTPPPSLRPI